MNSKELQINNFFIDYEQRVNDFLTKGSFDIEGTIKSFAECFVGANPLGVRCTKNDEHLPEIISQAYIFYKDIGITSMDIPAKEISFLDNYHTMVKVHWRCSFTKKDDTKGNIAFDVFYFLQARENVYKIFAWIAGDEQKALKEIGLI